MWCKPSPFCVARLIDPFRLVVAMFHEFVGAQYDILTEEQTRFYIAETALAIASVHGTRSVIIWTCGLVCGFADVREFVAACQCVLRLALRPAEQMPSPFLFWII